MIPCRRLTWTHKAACLVHSTTEAVGEATLGAEAMAPPAAAVAALRQLDEASVWRLLLQARAGRSPVSFAHGAGVPCVS